MSNMDLLYRALKNTEGAVTAEVLAVGWKAYPTNGAGKTNCAAIAYPYTVKSGAVEHLEGGVVDGVAGYVVRFADGSHGALQVVISTGAGKVWKFEGRGSRNAAWAMYRHNRSHVAFIPKNGEIVTSTVSTMAPAETDLFNAKRHATPSFTFTV